MRKKKFKFYFGKASPITIEARFFCFAKREAIRQYPITSDTTGITADMLTNHEAYSLKKLYFNADYLGHKVIKK